MTTSVAAGRFVELRVAYNGQPKEFRVNVHMSLRPILQRALAEFGVQPAHPDQYGLFLQGQSQPLDLDRKVEDLNLPENAVLILQQRTPPGGGC